MGAHRVPGPFSNEKLTGSVTDGTLVLAASATPAPTDSAQRLAGPVVATAAKLTSHDTDAQIEALDLRGIARIAAYKLKKAFPLIVFTSGRRNKEDQARAMASNVIKNRKWIEQTYARTELSMKCQRWVDSNPKKTVRSEIQEGLLSVLLDASDTELGYLSKHLSGDAFDVQPVVEDADRIKATLRSLVKPHGRFLGTEGGLVRWHAQF